MVLFSIDQYVGKNILYLKIIINVLYNTVKLVFKRDGFIMSSVLEQFCTQCSVGKLASRMLLLAEYCNRAEKETRSGFA